MDQNNRTRSFVPRSYEDFQPLTDWILDNTSETLLIRLPGFSKEQLKVQMDNFGNLRVIGERPLDAGGRRWSRFQTEHPIPHSCDVRGVRARFDNNILYITFPKLITEEPKPTVPPTPTAKDESVPTPEPEKKQPGPASEQKQEPESRKEEKEEVKEKKKEEKEEVKEKLKAEEEQKYVDDGEKARKGGVEAAPAALPAPVKMGIGFLEGIMRPRQVVVNMFVAVIVIVVIGIYVGHKLRISGGWGTRGE